MTRATRIFRLVGAVFLVALAGFAVQCTISHNVASGEARRKAESFCARFPLGASMEEVREAAGREMDVHSRRIEADSVTVGWHPGTFRMLHLCRISGENGRVVDAKYELYD